jgi:hypothetical protein
MNPSHSWFARRPVTACVLGLFAASPLWSGLLQPQAYEGGRSRNAEARAYRNASSVATMFGELRTAVSDIMFIKTERYLHSGVGYVAHVQEEVLSVSGAMEHVDEEQKEFAESQGGDPDDHRDCGDRHNPAHDAELLIRSEETDFRHWIGRMEREVKPYNPPGQLHVHADGRELLPWFRAMTISDPHYVTGYATGAWWLQSRNPDQALTYISEGIAQNPDAFQMYLTKGEILMSMARARDPDLQDLEEDPRRLVDEALATYQQGAAIVSRHWNQAEEWTPYEMEDAWALARLDVIMERKFGDPLAAADRARTYLRILGDDPSLRRLAGVGE